MVEFGVPAAREPASALIPGMGLSLSSRRAAPSSGTCRDHRAVAVAVPYAAPPTLEKHITNLGGKSRSQPRQRPWTGLLVAAVALPMQLPFGRAALAAARQSGLPRRLPPGSCPRCVMFPVRHFWCGVVVTWRPGRDWGWRGWWVPGIAARLPSGAMARLPGSWRRPGGGKPVRRAGRRIAESRRSAASGRLFGACRFRDGVRDMMRRRSVLVVLAGAAVWGAGPVAVPGLAGGWAVAAVRGAVSVVPAAAVRAAGSWGRAIEVPGLGVLNKDGNAGVSENLAGLPVVAFTPPLVSCASAGNCAAGGFYTDSRRRQQGFVAVERNGRWGRAIMVPGLRTLSAGRGGEVVSVSCGSAGGCAAGGGYWNHGHHGFAAVERNGRWGQAITLPGPVSSVSCGSAGGCAAGGDFWNHGHRGFVASERNGRWGQAIEVPGLGALSTGGNAGVSEVSCAPAGNCAAGGAYTDSSGNSQGFVASERNGVWGQAIEVPGLGALNAGGGAEVLSVSCGSAGNCAAGGGYTDSSGGPQGFVASEKNGVWGQAIEVPGLGALNASSDAPLAYVNSVSCPSAGNCLAGGNYGWPYSWAFVATEQNGVWGQAINIPGLGALVNGRWAALWSVSCASPGNCAAGGDDENMDHGEFTQAFVISQRNGRWDQAITVPGLETLNKRGSDGVTSVSCGSAGHCTAGGNYTDGHGHQQGFAT